MDESISTVLTILCNHTFHSQCLAQWEDASCPVCRHVQTPEQIAEQRCSECQSSEDLWICLVCGYIGKTVKKKSVPDLGTGFAAALACFGWVKLYGCIFFRLWSVRWRTQSCSFFGNRTQLYHGVGTKPCLGLCG